MIYIVMNALTCKDKSINELEKGMGLSYIRIDPRVWRTHLLDPPVRLQMMLEAVLKYDVCLFSSCLEEQLAISSFFAGRHIHTGKIGSYS